MFGDILKNIGFDNFVIIVASTIPFFIFVFLDLILLRKNSEKLSLKSIIWQNKIFIILIILVTSFIGSVVVAVAYFTTIPTIFSSKPPAGTNWVNYTDPLEVKFNVPVEISSLQPKVVPNIQGEWVWENFLATNYTIKGRFIPNQTVLPEKRIVVYIVGAKRAFNPNENHELALNILAPKAPTILKTTPSDKEEAIERESMFKIYFDKVNYYLSEWTYDIEPKIESSISDQFANYLEITPKTILAGDTQYTITLKRFPLSYDLKEKKVIEKGESDYAHTFTFKTSKDALIESFAPQGSGIRSDSIIKASFSMSMVPQSVEEHFEITPETPGSFKWINDKSFEFTPASPLEKGSDYKVTFKSGMDRIGAGPTQKDLSYVFQTIGAVRILSYSPSDGANNVNEASVIRINLDQEVDHPSAESKFRINPGIEGRFSWEGNDMIFTTNSYLVFNQHYTITLEKGVKSIYGQDLVDNHTFSFTIRSQESVIAGVPQLYQPYGSFSCNVYAGLMALAWKGHSLSSAGLIAETGYNEGTANGQWTGNPYVDYVGNYDGSYGYGIYWTALQIPFNNRGIKTQIVEGWNVQGMAQSIVDGHPVVIWRYNGESANYDKNWYASDGTYIRGINGQHGGLVIGVRGPLSNPEAFLVNDPWYGQYWYSADYLDYTWSRMNRTAMIVY